MKMLLQKIHSFIPNLIGLVLMNYTSVKNYVKVNSWNFLYNF